MPNPVTTSSGQVQLRDSNTLDHLLDSLPIDASNIIFSQLDKESLRACQSDKLNRFKTKSLVDNYQKANLKFFIIFLLNRMSNNPKRKNKLQKELEKFKNLDPSDKSAIQEVIGSVAKILSELPIKDLDALITKSEDRPLREKFYKHIIDLAGLYKQLSNPEACRVKISIKTAVLWACLGFFDKTNETAKAILELRGSNSLKIKHLKRISLNLEASGLISDALHIANLIPSEATKVKEKTIDQILKNEFNRLFEMGRIDEAKKIAEGIFKNSLKNQLLSKCSQFYKENGMRLKLYSCQRQNFLPSLYSRVDQFVRLTGNFFSPFFS